MVPLNTLAEIIKAADSDLKLTMMHIGAIPIVGDKEPFHELLTAFPGSQIAALDLNQELCAGLNRSAPPGMRYYPVALGRTEETRPLYETHHPMCTSLFAPNEALLALYNNLVEWSGLKLTSSVDTIGLDRFATDHAVVDVDFIKIDVQGAELNVFQGGTGTLRDVVAVVTEVEFVPLYTGQPLFGDVCAFLSEQGLMFHKFLWLAGRALQPTIMNDDPSFAVQHLWSDAMFIRDVLSLSTLSPKKLLKLAVLSHLYHSPDLTFHCLAIYDQQCGTHVLQKLLQRQQVSAT
jgi:FkbM family methyltransferase